MKMINKTKSCFFETSPISKSILVIKITLNVLEKVQERENMKNGKKGTRGRYVKKWGGDEPIQETLYEILKKLINVFFLKSHSIRYVQVLTSILIMLLLS